MSGTPDSQNIVRGELIGFGSYKKVYKAIDRKRGIEVALCEIPFKGEVAECEKILDEIDILEQLKHENIIQLYSAWIEDDNLKFTTELMTSGTLHNFVKSAAGVSIRVIKDWCKQILQGLSYLHTRNPPIIHRDIKLDNMFFCGAKGRVKIGDMGLATVSPKSIIGTPEFMAPETYDEKYNVKVDIWAFGMCVIEMTTLEYPYSECSNIAEVFKSVKNGLRPKAILKIIDPYIVEFISCCLEVDQNKRLSSQELLYHPFLMVTEDNHQSYVQLRSEEETKKLGDTIQTKEDWEAYFERMREQVRKRHISLKARPQSGIIITKSFIMDDDQIVTEEDFLMNSGEKRRAMSHSSILHRTKSSPEDSDPDVVIEDELTPKIELSRSKSTCGILRKNNKNDQPMSTDIKKLSDAEYKKAVDQMKQRHRSEKDHLTPETMPDMRKQKDDTDKLQKPTTSFHHLQWKYLHAFAEKVPTPATTGKPIQTINSKNSSLNKLPENGNIYIGSRK